VDLRTNRDYFAKQDEIIGFVTRGNVHCAVRTESLNTVQFNFWP